MAEITISDKELRALRNEIRLSEKVIETLVQPKVEEFVARYTNTFRPSIATNWSLMLNEIYPIVQYNLPSTFFRNPRAFLKPRTKTFIAKRRNLQTGGALEDVILDSTKSANTQSAILNYKIEQIRYKQEARKTLMDGLLFPYGVLWHGYKGNFGMTEEQSLYVQDEDVFVQRVGPMNFLWDPSTSIERIDEGMWVGRSFWVRLMDVLEDDKLHVDKKTLKGKAGFGDRIPVGDEPKGGGDTKVLSASSKPLIEFAEKEFAKSEYAQFLKLYEVFKRPSKKERREGKKGKVLLLAFEQEHPLRRNSWDYKAEGWPAKILMFNPVPEMKVGMADPEIYKGEADHKNLVINQQIRNAEQLNKTWVGIAKESIAGGEDLEKIKKGENTIVLFEGDELNGRMFVAHGAGSSSELYQLDTRIDRSLQDKSGVSDLKRGFLQSGEESAASVKLRNAGSSARPAYRQDIMAEFLKESFLYLNQLLKQYVTFDQAVRISGSLDIEWSDVPEDKASLQADVDCEIDVYSMVPESPEKELQELSTILNLMTQAITTPAILQKIQQEGKTFNLAPVIENLLLRLRLRDPDVFREIKPEESEGFAAVAELRAAQANVGAALGGGDLPSPPAPGQDHRARLEIYTAIKGLMNALNQHSELLEQLIQLQVAVMEEENSRNQPKIGGAVKPVQMVESVA